MSLSSSSTLQYSILNIPQPSADMMGVDLGKRLMQNSKPFDMKKISVMHNTMMFALSLYMVIETLTQVRLPQHLVTMIS